MSDFLRKFRKRDLNVSYGYKSEENQIIFEKNPGHSQFRSQDFSRDYLAKLMVLNHDKTKIFEFGSDNFLHLLVIFTKIKFFSYFYISLATNLQHTSVEILLRIRGIFWENVLKSRKNLKFKSQQMIFQKCRISRNRISKSFVRIRLKLKNQRMLPDMRAVSDQNAKIENWGFITVSPTQSN